ncbi:MAG: transcriptional regulator PpsR [Alphaproteobacteria bacterium PA4]|nr:MAG: transcriptional regulator PpsR [Alphaproteobacteria bacterium PA4]
MDASTTGFKPQNRAAPLTALADLPFAAMVQGLLAMADIALLIDSGGVILDLALGFAEMAPLPVTAWPGRPWRDTVVADNRGKIDAMLAGDPEPARWRLVNHSLDDGELPIRYRLLPAGPGHWLAIGQDQRHLASQQQRLIAAQQAMERDTLQLRQAEARYRLLFAATSEAVLIVDPAEGTVLDANPAALRLIGSGGAVGLGLATLVHPDSRATVGRLLAQAVDQASPVRVRLPGGDNCLLSVATVQQDWGQVLLARLRVQPGDRQPAQRRLDDLLERMPDAFVLTDADLRILACNQAFIDLLHKPRGAVIRTPLNAHFGQPGMDVALLAAELAGDGRVQRFVTTVRRGGDAGECAVSVAAVSARDGAVMRHGFSLQAVSASVPPLRQTPRSVEQLTSLVGHMALKDIVRESTDLIERLCIEAALQQTGDNRASAAEMLGLSRQSLYAKLHRHHLGNLDHSDE